MTTSDSNNIINFQAGFETINNSHPRKALVISAKKTFADTFYFSILKFKF